MRNILCAIVVMVGLGMGAVEAEAQMCGYTDTVCQQFQNQVNQANQMQQQQQMLFQQQEMQRQQDYQHQQQQMHQAQQEMHQRQQQLLQAPSPNFGMPHHPQQHFGY